MARIKYTALVESISGSIGGSTFQRNAYGFTVKNKPNMVRPNRVKQAQRKLSVANNSRAWSSLSSANRTAWETWAQAVPLPSRLNPDSNLNGFNYFQKYHNIQNQGGIFGILNNPGVGTFPFSLEDVSVTISGFGDNLTVSGSINGAPNDWNVFVYLSSVMKASQIHIPVTPRFMGFQNTDDPFSIVVDTPYLAAFGNLPAENDFVGVRIAALPDLRGQIEIMTATRFPVVGA